MRDNEKIVQAVDLKHFPLQGLSLIEASAGTGKTYTIAHLYLRILLEKQYSVSQILVVTFTIAATDELRGRIRQLIAAALKSLNGDNSADITPELEQILSPYRTGESAKNNLQHALICFDEAAIFTIHGFCQQVLQNMVVESASPFDVEFIGSERSLELQLAQDFWRKNVIALDAVILRWLLAQFPSPASLLAAIKPALIHPANLVVDQPVALKLESVKQLKTQFEKLQQTWRSNSEQIGKLLLNSPALNRQKYQKKSLDKLITGFDNWINAQNYLNLPVNFSRLFASSILQSLKKDKTDENLQHHFFEDCEAYDQLLQNWQQKQSLMLFQSVIDFIRQGKILQKQRDRNQSFDDLISRLHFGLNQAESTLAEKIGHTFPLALVDEFQDTDLLQYQIFSQIYQPQKDAALILIGDPKQAIYSFRGADVFTYQLAKQQTSQQFTLDTNFRSSQHYIEAINQIFSQQENVFRFDQLMTYHAVKSSKDECKCLVEGKPLPAINYWLMPSQEKAISKEKALNFMAEACASEIAQILQQQKIQIKARSVNASDLAILVRSARQGLVMQEQLRLKNINSVMVSNQSIYHSQQADDIVLLLAVLTDAQNLPLLFGLLASRLFGWNSQQIDQLQTNSQAMSALLQQFAHYRKLSQRQGVFCMLLQLFRDQNTVQRALQESNGDRCLTNWLQLIELLQQHAQQHASLNQTLSFLQLQRQAESLDADDEAQLRLDSDDQLVRIVTIHKSKGLEYGLVFLPFIWDVHKSFTHVDKIYSYHDDEGHNKLAMFDDSHSGRYANEQFAEQMRLFYVAMTRAKYACYFGWGQISGAGSSALAACLFADKLPPRHPGNLVLESDAEITDVFDRLGFYRSKPDQDCMLSAPLLGADTRSLPKIFAADVYQRWRVSSYSALARSAADHAAGAIDSVRSDNNLPDYDAVDVEKTEVIDAAKQFELITHLELTRFTFPRGSKPGNFLHEILEMQPFDQAIDVALIAAKLAEYGFESHWLDCLQTWITDILQTPLDDSAGKKLSLNQLKKHNTLDEMEFYFPVDEFKAKSLNSLLHQHGILESNHPGYDFLPLSGFIKGFIDLTFEWQGKFYICDYKSNFLGDKPEDYDADACELAMREHHYHLQYLIYSLALHRYLSNRMKDYRYEQHFGGVYYLFLRGMQVQADDKHGVMFYRPEQGLIEKLDTLIGNNKKQDPVKSAR